MTRIGAAQVSRAPSGSNITMTWKIYFIILLSVFEGGCAESHVERAQRLEPMLAQAGFRMVQANTPARTQKLADMMPLRMSYVSRNGKLSYWFADPMFVTASTWRMSRIIVSSNSSSRPNRRNEHKK